MNVAKSKTLLKKDTLLFVMIWRYSKRIWPWCIDFTQKECTLSDNHGGELIMFREDNNIRVKGLLPAEL